jgi:hypothetical protein
MKLSLECSIKGKVKIGKEIRVIQGCKEYVLIPDSEGWLSKIKIIKKVDVPGKYSARIGPGKGKATDEVRITGDREERMELIGEFQELEGILSFDTIGSLQSIEWDAPITELIGETEEEEEQVQVSGIGFKKEYPEYPASLDEEGFARIIRSKQYYVSLIVPQAFFREGANEFASMRYINAFYNFYFILEGLYGKGKTRNKDVAKEFKESAEFRGFVDSAIKDLNDKYPPHKVRIERFCREESLSYDTDGIIELLWKVRGNLHHYSTRSSKHQGTPLDNEDFESIAFLALGLAARCILERIKAIYLNVKARKKIFGY